MPHAYHPRTPIYKSKCCFNVFSMFVVSRLVLIHKFNTGSPTANPVLACTWCFWPTCAGLPAHFAFAGPDNHKSKVDSRFVWSLWSMFVNLNTNCLYFVKMTCLEHLSENCIAWNCVNSAWTNKFTREWPCLPVNAREIHPFKICHQHIWFVGGGCFLFRETEHGDQWSATWSMKWWKMSWLQIDLVKNRLNSWFLFQQVFPSKKFWLPGVATSVLFSYPHGGGAAKPPC